MSDQPPITRENIVAIVEHAMRDAWNDICADSGARPSDLYKEGRATFFEPGPWARLTGEWVATRLEQRGMLLKAAIALPEDER